MKKQIIAFTFAATLASLSTSAFAQSSTPQQSAPPEEFKPSGKFTMQFFGDYFYQIGASDSIGPTDGASATNTGRMRRSWPWN